MRIKSVSCKSYQTAKNQCPWASKIVRVTDGFMCFESMTDYETWKRQK